MAPRYRIVSTCWRRDERVRRLSAPAPNAQTLHLELLIGEFTTAIPGIVCAGMGALAESLGWPVDGVRAAWAEIAAEGMALADWEARLVWLPKAVRHGPPENPNGVKGWLKHWRDVPECGLRAQAARGIADELRRLGPAYVSAWAPALGIEAVAAAPEEGAEEHEHLIFPCNGMGAKHWSAPATFVEELHRAYPSVDVNAELLKARLWCVNNPVRRKTPGGMRRFLSAWMSRTQDDPRSNGGGGGGGGTRVGAGIADALHREAEELRARKAAEAAEAAKEPEARADAQVLPLRREQREGA